MKLPLKIKTLIAMSFLTSCLMSFVSGAVPLAVGAAAPAVKSVDQNGKAVDLGELYKGGYVLVYFYPKAATRGCTAEACSLRDAYASLTKNKLTIVGVSHDSVAAQKEFADDQKLPFTLLADTKGEVYAAFGVPGAMNRQSFLVKDGKIVWEDLKASTDKQAADVQKALDADKAGAPGATPAAASAPSAASAPAKAS